MTASNWRTAGAAATAGWTRQLSAETSDRISAPRLGRAKTRSRCIAEGWLIRSTRRRSGATSAKDCLRATPHVPAVEEFRKAVADAEKPKGPRSPDRAYVALSMPDVVASEHCVCCGFFVYIPHDPCPRSTTVLSSAPSAGRTTSHSNSNATTTSKAAPMPNCNAWPNPSAAGSLKTISRPDRGWRSWPTTTRAGSRLIWASSPPAALRFHSIPPCTTTRSSNC